MDDFSKTQVTKNHKNSFDKMISSIAFELEDIKNNYYKVWLAINEDRKILADCVEHCIALTKKSGIIPPKNLDQFNRLELVDFLLENNYKYNKEDRDSLIEFARIIKERYLQIQVNVPKLLELEQKLSKYHIVENDYDDEVELDLTLYRKEEPKEEDNDLINLVEQAINLKEDDVEYILIDIKNDTTLMELAEKFYENSDYWIYIYDFKDNKKKIDEICAKNNILLDVFASTKGLLKGLSLKFPEEIKTYTSNNYVEHSRI